MRCSSASGLLQAKTVCTARPAVRPQGRFGCERSGRFVRKRWDGPPRFSHSIRPQNGPEWVSMFHQRSGGGPMQEHIVIGLDTGKDVFHLLEANRHGGGRVRRKFTRRRLISYLSNHEKSLIGLEACAGSHHLARKLGAFGHTVRTAHPSKTVERLWARTVSNSAGAHNRRVDRPSTCPVVGPAPLGPPGWRERAMAWRQMTPPPILRPYINVGF